MQHTQSHVHSMETWVKRRSHICRLAGCWCSESISGRSVLWVSACGGASCAGSQINKQPRSRTGSCTPASMCGHAFLSTLWAVARGGTQPRRSVTVLWCCLTMKTKGLCSGTFSEPCVCIHRQRTEEERRQNGCNSPTCCDLFLHILWHMVFQVNQSLLAFLFFSLFLCSPGMYSSFRPTKAHSTGWGVCVSGIISCDFNCRRSNMAEGSSPGHSLGFRNYWNNAFHTHSLCFPVQNIPTVPIRD